MPKLACETKQPLTHKLALSQQLQMCPEDVARVMGNVPDKLGVGQAAEVAAVHGKVADVDVGQTKLFDCPLDPVTDMNLRPVHGVC